MNTEASDKTGATTPYDDQIRAAWQICEADLDRRLRCIGADVRSRIVAPFCQKFDLAFDAEYGVWVFRTLYEGADKGRVWDVGYQPRPLPGRPAGIDGEAECWFAPITAEEKNIDALLRTPDGHGGEIGEWITSYSKDIK